MKLDGLKDIIESRNLDWARLSERASISVERLHQILAGEDLSLRELRLLAAALHVPISAIVLPDQPLKNIPFLFRAADTATEAARSVALAVVSTKIDYALELLGGPTRAKPWWAESFKHPANSYVGAEENARAFREIFFNDDQASPLLALPSIVLDKMEALLFVADIPNVDGASACIHALPFIFVSRRYEARMLFTLAHELAHITAPGGMDYDFVLLDELAEAGVQKKRNSEEEKYAHAFASCLLMPGPGIGIALQKIREIYEIKSDQLGDIEVLLLSRIFGVSFAAAARRCEDLRLLPRGGAASLNERLTKEFGSPEKRAVQVGLPPRPKIDFRTVPKQLLTAALNQIREGAISVGKASAILGLSISDLLSLNEPV